MQDAMFDDALLYAAAICVSKMNMLDAIDDLISKAYTLNDKMCAKTTNNNWDDIVASCENNTQYFHQFLEATNLGKAAQQETAAVYRKTPQGYTCALVAYKTTVKSTMEFLEAHVAGLSLPNVGAETNKWDQLLEYCKLEIQCLRSFLELPDDAAARQGQKRKQML